MIGWIASLRDGRRIEIPFECQRCGQCCRTFLGDGCPMFQEPNICTIYEDRPYFCRDYPVWADFGTSQCPSHQRAQKQWHRMGAVMVEPSEEFEAMEVAGL